MFISELVSVDAVGLLVRGFECYALNTFQAAGEVEASESSGRMRHDGPRLHG